MLKRGRENSKYEVGGGIGGEKRRGRERVVANICIATIFAILESNFKGLAFHNETTREGFKDMDKLYLDSVS